MCLSQLCQCCGSLPSKAAIPLPLSCLYPHSPYPSNSLIVLRPNSCVSKGWISSRSSFDWKRCFLNLWRWFSVGYCTETTHPVSARSLALNSMEESWWHCVARSKASPLRERSLLAGTALTGNPTDIISAPVYYIRIDLILIGHESTMQS